MIRRACIFAMALLGTGLIASSVFAQAPPPVAPVRPVTDDYFGTKVVDNYRYFENLNDPEVQQWMKAQADYTDTVLASIPGRARFLARLHELDASDSVWISDVWHLPGSQYFYLKRSGNQSDLKLYQRTGLSGAERLLVDPGTITLAPQNRGKGPSSIEHVSISANGRYVAVGITPGGAERDCELHVIDVATGRETGDVILRVNGGAASWLPGDSAFLYDQFPDLPAGAPPSQAEQRQRTYLHRIGTNTQDDRAVFGYDVVPSIHVKPAEFADAIAESMSDFAIGLVGDGVSLNEATYIAPVQSIGSATTPWQKVADYSDDVTAATVHGNDLYLLTFKDASHYKIVRTDARHPDLATATTVVPAERRDPAVHESGHRRALRRTAGRRNHARAASTVGSAPQSRVPARTVSRIDQCVDRCRSVGRIGVSRVSSSDRFHWQLRSGHEANIGYASSARGSVRQSVHDRDRRGQGRQLRRHAGAAHHRLSEGDQAGRLASRAPHRVRRLWISGGSVLRPHEFGHLRTRSSASHLSRSRRRRLRRGVASRREEAHQAEHVEGFHCVRRVPDRQGIHVAGAPRGRRRERRRHPDRPGDRGTARPLRRSDRRRPRRRHAAPGDHGQRRAEHRRVRQHEDGSRLPRALCDESVRQCEGWREISRRSW